MFGYVANDPINAIDPRGTNPVLIIIGGAGVIQGGINAYQAGQAGASAGQVISSFGVGFVAGATSATGAIFGGIGGGIASSALGGAINNAGNQLIFNGQINGGDLAGAAVVSGAAGLTGSALGGGLTSIILTPEAGNALGGVLGGISGLTASSGIPNQCH